jgi:hypothetical protein
MTELSKKIKLFYQGLYIKKEYENVILISEEYEGLFLKYNSINGRNDFLKSLRLAHQKYSFEEITPVKVFQDEDRDVCCISSMVRIEKTIVQRQELMICDVFSFNDRGEISKRVHYKLT